MCIRVVYNTLVLQTRSRFQHFPETTAGTHNVICSGKGPALIKENSARSGMPELPNDLAASRLAPYARMSQNGGGDHDLTRCDFGQGAPRHQYLVGRRFTKSSALHPIRSAKQNKHVIITCNPRGRGDEIFISSLDASKVVVTCSGTRGPRCAGSVLRSVLRFSLHLIQHL